MTTETAQPAAGTTTEDSANPPAPTPKETVAYETHRKLLDEKKKLQAKLEQIETDRKSAEEAELTRKGEIQKLLDMERKRAQDLELKVKAQDEERLQARKLSAIVKGLSVPVDQKWYSVLGGHLDDVILNEAGEIEQMSVTSVVENLKKEWPEMLKKPSAGMPNGAPQGNGAATISYDDWKKLPLKDMKKWRQSQII
jgi:hypothetical protein